MPLGTSHRRLMMWNTLSAKPISQREKPRAASSATPVSYTHLDVYKRQLLAYPINNFWLAKPAYTALLLSLIHI